ncbi:elongation factor Tu, putative [Plasmodium ovale]|uniref:Elongation factor Tu, putative n=1 Tax=Plasmodium ovale TaxID=36330 RepID=A0A1D3TJZ9_PLAOA|nr:elongation factor Tu, putative [Plasmodium ovale]
MDLVKHLNDSNRIRNICILAHVDHGKTTLVDNLISSNKIISDKNIGKVKYLDNREDEQKRQITMKSSSILLKHTYNENYLNEMFISGDASGYGSSGKDPVMQGRSEEDVRRNGNEEATTLGERKNDRVDAKKLFGDSREGGEKITTGENSSNSCSSNTYLINIIDTPGHVDFSSEVSTCVRICDGSLILIDCIEGLCSQTKIVLRQTWKEMIKCILVINKIDKLITNKHMDSMSAYEHINNIIEQVNAYIYQLYVEENMNNENIETSELEKHSYSPLKGNVLLCSSIHCWCVDINIFSFLFCKKMNIDVSNCHKIKKYMWNQYYFNMKEKKILKIPNDTTFSTNNNAIKKKKKNLFSLVVLDFLWQIYDITTINRDDDKIKKLCAELNISDSFLKKSQSTGKGSTSQAANKSSNNKASAGCSGGSGVNPESNTFVLTYIMSHFLNLSRSIFNACIEMFPSPKRIDEGRLFKIFPSLYNEKIYENIINCSTTRDFTTIYISKYICANVQNNTLVGFKGFYDKNTFLSICRIYSGVLYQNMILYICGKGIKTIVKRIYICMGGDLLPIKEAFAGNIVAVYLSIINEKECQNGKDMERGNLPNEGEKREEEYIRGDTECSLEKKKIMNNSGSFTNIENEMKNADDIYTNGHTHMDGCNTRGNLQYLSKTLMNLIKNKRSKKEQNIFLMNNDGIFLNKNITLSSQKNMDSFILPFADTCSTILHTIIEPKNIQDMSKFLYGLILLHTCDTSIDIDFNDRGEYILKFCGEIHMQKCLSDFVNIYSNIEIKTSDTNISIREGINENNIKVKKKKNKIQDNLKDLYNYYTNVKIENQSKNYEQGIINMEMAKESYKNASTIENCSLNRERSNTVHNNEYENLSTKQERGNSLHPFKNIHIEKENIFLNKLFNYSHNIVCHKLNNNAFYVFLSVLNMPEKMLHFFDKHYSSIQTILENRSISPPFLNYNKVNFSDKNEHFMYKQCLINLENCVNKLCFSDKVDYDSIMGSASYEEENEMETASDSEKNVKREKQAKRQTDVQVNGQTVSKTAVTKEYNLSTNSDQGAENNIHEKGNFLRKNKNYQLDLWDICVQNGSITLLYIKKYFNKKKRNEYLLDNILTNEKYKNIINQRSFIDTYLSDTNSDINIYLNNLCLGFKLASKYGPIAQEPIRGALFIIEGLIIDEAPSEELFEGANREEENAEQNTKVATEVDKDMAAEEKINAGNVIALMKEACLNSMQQSKLRIFEPMLRLNLTCESNVLGKVYNVLLKRRCSILSEEIKDGYFLYCIDAYLPLFNSFKLAEELRSKCSGNVIYDIQFSHWNKLNEDIFLLTDTSTVLYDEDFDVKLTDNTATEIVNYIRRTKGLETNEKIIQKPEKQCTLKK